MQNNQRRSRSRSPVLRCQDDNARTLHISNIPRDWDFDKIKEFIRKSARDPIVSQGLRFVDVIKNKGECLAKFSTSAAAFKGLRDLNGVSIGDRRLLVRMNDNPGNSKLRGNKYSNDSPIQDKKPQLNENIETYGLSISFLNSLGMSPPLVNRIFVNNLDPRVTEEKLQEVFGMAGTITNLILIRKNENTGNEKISAKIEYDHPVEAVQAVSMFHGQELYEKRILTRLDTLTKGSFTKLPQGLKNIGSGLGSNGQPMKNIRLNLEMQALKQELSSKVSDLNNKPFDNQMNPDTNNAMYGADTPNQFMAGMNNLNQSNSQMLLNAMFNGIAPNNTQIWGTMMQNPLALALQTQSGGFNQLNSWKSGNQLMMNQAGMMQGNMDSVDLNNQSNFPMMPQSMLCQGNQDNNRRRFEDRDQVFADDNMDLSDNRPNNDENGRNEASDMVLFTNLPQSVSSQVLKSKMREIGDVKFVEMNGQGRAIVRFFSARDGERCQKMFHKSRVDGQIINVNYF